MRKLTRRAYNRKVLVFGISIFMSIAMISTGFAAWVLSSVTGVNDAAAPVQVAVVTDNSITMTVEQWEEGEWKGATLSFDAKTTDTEGRVKAGEDANEVLTLPIDITITGAGTLSAASMRIDLPETIANAMGSAKQYLTLKKIGAYTVKSITFAESGDVETATVNGSKEIETLKITKNTKKVDSNDVTVYSFIVPIATTTGEQNMSLEFGWGEYFAGMNPCEFYDLTTEDTWFRNGETVTGKPTEKIDAATVSAEMGGFETFMGITTEEDEEIPYSGTIYITVSGSAE